MSKHNKGKELFFKDMFMVIPMTMIFTGANLVKLALGFVSCHKLNNCNKEFQLELLKKLLKVGCFCHFTSFVVTMFWTMVEEVIGIQIVVRNGGTTSISRLF
jgi:hypothetical protein